MKTNVEKLSKLYVNRPDPKWPPSTYDVRDCLSDEMAVPDETLWEVWADRNEQIDSYDYSRVRDENRAIYPQ